MISNNNNNNVKNKDQSNNNNEENKILFKEEDDKIQKKKKELRMDKKFYSQISYQIQYNQSFSNEMKETISRIMNEKILDNDDVDAIIDCAKKYLQLNFYHQRCGKMICSEKPPPIKQNILLKIFEKIINYFIIADDNYDEFDTKDKELQCIGDFLHKFQHRSRQKFSVDNLYKTLLLSYYGYASYSFHAITDIAFPKPDDPMIDFSKEDIPIHLMSLNKRYNKKFTVCNQEKKFKLLQKLVMIVFNDFLSGEKDLDNQKKNYEREILKQMIVADMRNCLNLFDPLVVEYPYLAGLVSIVSFLTDVVFLSCRRLSFRKK